MVFVWFFFSGLSLISCSLISSYFILIWGVLNNCLIGQLHNCTAILVLTTDSIWHAWSTIRFLTIKSMTKTGLCNSNIPFPSQLLVEIEITSLGFFAKPCRVSSSVKLYKWWVLMHGNQFTICIHAVYPHYVWHSTELSVAELVHLQEELPKWPHHGHECLDGCELTIKLMKDHLTNSTKPCLT